MELRHYLLKSYDETRVLERIVMIGNDTWWMRFSLDRRGVASHGRVFGHKYVWCFKPFTSGVWFEYIGKEVVED